VAREGEGVVRGGRGGVEGGVGTGGLEMGGCARAGGTVRGGGDCEDVFVVVVAVWWDVMLVC
jgi:hypothetical protein